MVAGFKYSTPREGVAAAEEEAAGRDVSAVAVAPMALTSTTQIMAGSMEWTAPTSGDVSLENNLTRLGAMGACMYLRSTIVIMTSATSRRFSKAGRMVGRS